MRITFLARGGLSVYGGIYDPHRNEVVLYARDGETSAVTIEYPDAPTAATVALDGVGSTAPAISGNKVSLTLSGIQNGGKADITATIDGEARIVRIRGRAPAPVDRYDIGPYGSW